MPKTLARYKQVRKGDNLGDQQTPSQVAASPTSAVTQDDLQAALLSQIRRIIWGDPPPTQHWYEDFSVANIQNLLQLTRNVEQLFADFAAPSSVKGRIGLELLGPTDGANRVFTAPAKFIHVAGQTTIEVFHNGRRLKQATSENAALGDYFIFESGGAGMGWDTVKTLTFTPSPLSKLVANFVAA